MIDYDKKDLVRRFVDQMEEGVDQLAEATESSRMHSIQSEGCMQTRYGSAKEEHGYMADTLNLRTQGKSAALVEARYTNLPENPRSVQLGCVVRLRDSESGDTSDYFVLREGGGEFIEVGEDEIAVITTEAPLYGEMYGLGRGDTFTFKNPRGREFSYVVEDLI
tara:strand:- start:417 stop:908 length:492 start_codon:yes stop_codon:yes gene_type:complete